jgi:hypothetical protein
MALFTLPRTFAVVAALSLVACSGADPSTAHQSSPDQSNPNGDQSCGGLVSQATDFTFTTSTTIPTNPAPSVDVTVSDPTTVQALFQETNALPVLPAGQYNCPADFGVTYHLTFVTQNGTTQYVLDPGGCETVTIASDSSVVLSANPQYWQTLAAALGVPETSIYPYAPN